MTFQESPLNSSTLQACANPVYNARYLIGSIRKSIDPDQNSKDLDQLASDEAS